MDTRADASLDAGTGAERVSTWNGSRRVDVGGYELAVDCTGEGSPVVVLEAGYGDGIEQWGRVPALVGEFTRVCAYDRAGRGVSEGRPLDDQGMPELTDGQKVARDLRALLNGAGVEPPIVLVGHSMGGLFVRVYADRHPGEVWAVVLVDASHPDQFARGRRLPDADDRELFAADRLQEIFSSGPSERLELEATLGQTREADRLGATPLCSVARSRVPAQRTVSPRRA